ncbi:LysE family translocator [Erwinia persicina]|uniref:LysE family translocator n=1 Tax=Erwinia persicina TaxID=55211 RepID=UPI001FCE8E5C|nr:LysE family translocator [Erwinia persicina]
METFMMLLPVYVAYLLGTASPGPSNMAIMGVAMSQGRRPALMLAFGVITGSLCWALLVATGLSALLQAWAQAIVAIKIVGGIYLLWMAWKAARSAVRRGEMAAAERASPGSAFSLYRRGLLLHLGNPKAILVWTAIMSLGIRPDAAAGVLPLIVGGCALLGIVVFSGYALLFSTAAMSRGYRRCRRAIEGVFAVFFTMAGLKLLMSR